MCLPLSGTIVSCSLPLSQEEGYLDEEEEEEYEDRETKRTKSEFFIEEAG